MATPVNPLKLSHLQFQLQRTDEDDPGGLLSSNPVPSSGAAGVAGGGGTSTSSSTSAIERARFSSSSSSVDSSEASNRAVSEGETNPPSTVLDSSKTLKTRDVMKQGTYVCAPLGNVDFFRALSQNSTKLLSFLKSKTWFLERQAASKTIIRIVLRLKH